MLFGAFILIFILSFFLAIRSMRDFNVPKEVKDMVRENKSKGTILFLKKNIKHYSSSSGSSE